MLRKILLTIILSIHFIYAYSQSVSWGLQNGWVLKKEKNGDFEKFFAIGFYGIPGYTLNRFALTEERVKHPNNRRIFDNISNYTNIFFLQSGFEKSYMNGMTKVVGSSEFPWELKRRYWPQVNDKVRRQEEAYLFMNTLKEEVTSSEFQELINKPIQRVKKSFGQHFSNLIWAPMDEVASGIDGWFWPPAVTDAIYNRIKAISNDLVFLNILGGGTGNSYLFARNHFNLASPLPKTPPFDLVFNRTKNNLSLFHLHTNYKGESIWEYKNNKLVVKKLNDISIEDEWYQNVKQTYSAYRHSADIWSFNSYKSFFSHPKLAGITVKAIKDGVGKDKPVWLFFDADGHARPKTTSVADYVDNVKCQMYISLIHEATGILLYAGKKQDNSVFEALVPAIKEISENSELFKMKRIEAKLDGDLQYLIVQGLTGRQTAIIVNTSKTKTITVLNSKLPRKVLLPLEVIISKI